MHASVPALLADRARRTPDATAFMVQTGDGAWRAVTWRDYAGRVARLSAAIATRGIGPGARVAILAPTSIEWEYAQLAALQAGACVAGVDPHYPDEVLNRVLANIAPTALFVWDEAALSRLSSGIVGRARLVVSLSPGALESSAGRVRLADLDQPAPGYAVPVASPAPLSPAAPALIVFSSGTSGTPKSIVYTHDQVRLAVDAILEAFPDIGEEGVLVCWLPLANLFQRIINFCAIVKGAASYVVSDPRAVMDVVPVASPHLLIGVPRFFERVHAGIQARLASSPAARALAAAAIGVAKRTRESGRARRFADPLLGPALDRLVLRRLRGVFGRNIRYFVSGSAPMPHWLLEWFDAIGLPVLEAYGASEDIVPIALNRPTQKRLGSVGKPLVPNRVELGPDGEILVSGPGLGQPFIGGAGEAATGGSARVLATGDYGAMDADGFLYVTGRKADAFKSPGGIWIAPAEVEGRLRRIPYVEHAVLTSAEGRAVVAILAIDAGVLRGGRTHASTRDADPVDAPLTVTELAALQRDVEDALHGVPGHSRPVALVATLRGLSIAGGELTTNLKLRRRVVQEKYRESVRLAAATAERQPAPPSAGASARLAPVVVQA